MAFELTLTETLFIHALVGVFVIVNPFGNVPLFISLTQKFTTVERRNAIVKSIVIATAILLVFALIGKFLFDILNVSLDSLRIAGGLLLLAIAFDLWFWKLPIFHGWLVRRPLCPSLFSLRKRGDCLPCRMACPRGSRQHPPPQPWTIP